MNIFKNDFEKQWPELSNDVVKLNEYTKDHPVEFSNTKVSDLYLEGVIFSGAIFNNIEWENINASKSALTNVVFKKCKFIGGNWKQGTLTNVTFDDCEFVDTSLSGCTVTQVSFKNCKMNHTGIGYLKGNKVEFEGCNWGMGAGGDSRCEFIFKGCTLSGISFSMMQNNVPILFEDTLLDEIDFFGSHFSTVTLRRVKQGEGPVRFNGATMERITIEDADLWRGLSLSEVKANSVSIEGGKVKTSFAKSIISKIYARNAELYQFSVRQSKLPYISITDCNIHDFPMWDGFVEEMHVQNCSISKSNGENFKADTVIWDNVTLDGKIDFTNAQVKDFQATRLKRGPKLQLITTGSNLKF